MNAIKKIKNQSGLGLIELMVSMAIMIIVLGGTIMVFTEQQSRIEDENDTAKVRAKGRHAIKLVAREVRMAGFGLPPGLGVTSTPANSVNFRFNMDNTRAFVDPSSDISSGSTALTVTAAGDAALFSNNDNVVVYNPNGGATDDNNQVSSVFGSVITLSSGLGEDYNFGVFSNITTINKFNNYTIQANGTNIERITDGGTPVILVNDIAPNGLTFEYFDFSDAATADTTQVQKIGITLNMLDPTNPDAVMEFKTDVQIRNSNL
jgi:Tfp pilus assembly protein PilW